jgi:MOSC domain-containing protein YiiM
MPVESSVHIGRLGMVDDFIGDVKNHGGPDQAILVYGCEDYAWWATVLGRTLMPGTFGENLTISELESAGYHVGDRLRVGEVVLEVTAPRTPCSTLAARMGNSDFVKMYRDAERPGMYCRVIEGGTVHGGDPVEVTRSDGELVTMLDMFRNKYLREKDENELRRLLRAPVSTRARASLERDLQRITAGRA